MSTSDLVLAAAMLTAPVGTPEITPHPDRFKIVCEAVHKTAINWEIMDERESRYMLANADDFQGDLDILRTRYEALKDAPKIADAQRFPDRCTISHLIKFNREYKKYLEERLLFESDRADVIEEAIQETDACYRQWDSLQDAQCPFYYLTHRRMMLKKFRDYIGEEAFATGQVPPYVPEWRFSK